MDTRTVLDFLNIAEKLKCHTRHSWTSSGRHESVAEHTCRLCMFAWLVKDEFPDCDIDKVMKMCLFHDLGEAVTGDIACFDKNECDREREDKAIVHVISLLPESEQKELQDIFNELNKGETAEAKLVHALDKMEAVIQHNEASIDSWLDLEYELQLTYGQEQAKAFPYLEKLREAVKQDSLRKIEQEGKKETPEGFYVSKDTNKIRLENVVKLLEQSYWAKGRSREITRTTIEHSICYGVFDKKDNMVGYARIITDHARVFYLMDVIIDEKYRHQGLGTLLMDAIMKDVGHLYGILHTKDAQGFYEKYGFTVKSKEGETVMERNLVK